jgi:hypothetical protein
MWRSKKLQVMADVPTTTAWLKPAHILQARYVKFGVQLQF